MDEDEPILQKNKKTKKSHNKQTVIEEQSETTTIVSNITQPLIQPPEQKQPSEDDPIYQERLLEFNRILDEKQKIISTYELEIANLRDDKDQTNRTNELELAKLRAEIIKLKARADETEEKLRKSTERYNKLCAVKKKLKMKFFK